MTGLSSNADPNIPQELPAGFSGFRTGCTGPPSIAGDGAGLAPWNDGEGPYPHVRLREPYRLEGCTTWHIYRNVPDAAGSGRLFEYTWTVGVQPAIHSGERGRIDGDPDSQGTPQAVADIDGDGYLDFLWVKPPTDPPPNPPTYDWSWSWKRFDPATGDVGNASSWWWGFPGGQPDPTQFPSGQHNEPHPDHDPPSGQYRFYPRSIIEFRDATGDGLPDWISGDTLRVNTGAIGFGHELEISVIGVPPEEFSRSETHVLGNAGDIDVIADRTLHVRPIDLDKDGITDYVDHRDGTVYWGAGHGVVHPSDTPLGEFVGGIEQRTRNQDGLWKVTQDQVDVDGDGLADKVMIDSFSDVASIWFMEPTGNAPPAVLREIDNGRGLTLEVSYAPHTDPAVVTMGDGDLPGSTWVVESMTAVHAHGNVAPATTTYRYDTPVRTEDNFGRRGFRGFEEVTVTGPSGAKTVSRYGYSPDWSGRLISTLVFPAGSTDPVTLADIYWSGGYLLGGTAVTFYTQSRTEQYACEQWVGGAVQTLDEATCRSQVAPRSRYFARETLEIGDEAFAKVPAGELDFNPDETPHPNVRVGFFTNTEHDFLYDADVYRIVPKRIERGYGSTSIEGGLDPGGWSLPDPSQVTERHYDTSLRVVVLECAARSSDDLMPGDLVNPGSAPCSASAYDLQTGLLLRTQKPEQYRDDPATLSDEYSTVFEYVDPEIPESQFKTYVAKTTSPAGHEVKTVVDLGTGVELMRTGPNVNQGNYQVIDGLGRTLDEWVSTSGTGDPSLPYNWKRTRVVVYEDLVQPQRVTEKLSRSPSYEESLTQSYTNNHWAEVRTQHDGAGRVIQVDEWDIDADHAVKTTVHRYGDTGDLIETRAPDPSLDDNAAQLSYLFHYDSLSRPTCTLAPDASGVATVHAGRETIVSEFAPDGLGGGTCASPETSVADAFASRRVVSDHFDRITGVYEALDAPTEAFTEYEYDGNNNISLIRREEPEPEPETETELDDIVTTLVHDWLGNRISIDRHGQTWSYTYDLNGNVESQVAPHGSGDPMDYTTTFFYDALDRLKSRVVHPGGVSSGDQAALAIGTTTFIYDEPLPGPFGSRPLGKLVRVEIGSWGHIELRYDARGNVYSEKRDFDLSAELGVPFSDTITTRNGSWNSFGQVHNIAHGTGVGTTRQYSRASSLPYSINATSTGESNYETFVLIRNASGLVSRYKHLSHDLTLGWKHGRQVHVPRDQLGRVTSEYSTDTGDDHISQTFTYYGSNEVESVISQVGPAANTRTFNFTYDRRHQLINAFDDKGYASGFEYSHSGRLKSAYVAASGGDGTLVYPRSVDYIYGAADPEIVTELDITGIPPDPEDPTTNDFASFDHDEAGNLIGRELGLQSWSFDYDSSNRMRRREIVGAGDELYYYHDDSRWLAVERDGGGNPTKARFWFGDVEVTYDCDASGCERENTRTYVRHGGRTFARVDEDAQGVRQMKLIHDSGLGHTLGVYDVELTGGVLEYDLELAFQYGPFGETLETLQLGTADPADFLQRFNGKELDPATGLSYYGYRFYDPLSLTWNRSDPLYRFVPDLALTSPRDANLYTFSLNNPVRYLDPDGLDSGGMGCMFSSGACWIDAGRMRNDGMVQTSLAEAAAREEARNRGAETFSQQTILANDGYDPYGTRYPDGGDKGGGSTEILKGLAVGGAVVFCAVKPWACIIGIAFGASTSHGPDKGCGIVVSTGAGCAAGCPRGGAGCSATAGNKIPLPTTKSTSFGPKIADPVPSRGVPKNWSKDQIADVVVDYKASIATRKVELGVFDAAGRGSATQRLAHARRITREEGFLRSLEKALGSRK